MYATILTLIVAYQTALLQWMLGLAERFEEDRGQDWTGRRWFYGRVILVSSVTLVVFGVITRRYVDLSLLAGPDIDPEWLIFPIKVLTAVTSLVTAIYGVAIFRAARK